MAHTFLDEVLFTPAVTTVLHMQMDLCLHMLILAGDCNSICTYDNIER